MKKKKIQNLIMVAIAAALIVGIVVYNYSVEQKKQKGFVFGNELEKIQNDVKDLQTKFYSKKAEWEEGSITKEELFQYYEQHIADFEKIISRYDELKPPESFQSSVNLLKLSSESQLESDKQYIEWMKTGDESFKIRSDTELQQAVDYEMSGLTEYYTAKTGVKPTN